MVVLLTYNTVTQNFGQTSCLENFHLEDQKVDGRIYVLLIMMMMMKVNQLEIDVETGRRMELVQDCVLRRNSA